LFSYSFYLGHLTLFDYSGHCKKLTPEYAAAAAILAERDPPIYLAKVDATENNALSERFEVKGFPTLHWFV
jgi:thioredoxin-like negative regulator of GroEL